MKRIITGALTRSRFLRALRFVSAAAMLLPCVSLVYAQTSHRADESAHILALDNSWNRALESKDTKALDLILADTFVSVDIDGSIQTKGEFLSSIKSPDYHPPAQAVTEQSAAEVYGDSAVVVGIFRTRGVDKGKKYTNRERYVDTWVRINGSWRCVASVTVTIPAKTSAD